MGLAVAYVLSAVLGNLTLVVATTAGGMRRGWRRGLVLACEIPMVLIWVVSLAVGPVVAASGGTAAIALAVLGGIASGTFGAYLLCRIEYSIFGRNFNDELPRSLWVGRFNLVRLNGDPP